MIIVVSGFRGSGKTLFGKIAKKMKCAVFEMSEPVFALMKELKMKINNENVRNFATDFRESGGMDAVAKLILPKIKSTYQEHKGERNIVIIGARCIEEVEIFRLVDCVLTIAIISDEKIRFARIKKRGNLSDPDELKNFRWADQVEVKWGLKKLVDESEMKIENNRTVEEFVEKVKSILASKLYHPSK
ncbi:MAG: AAA family ATPase [Candidatus Micrarchaeota archaeon]